MPLSNIGPNFTSVGSGTGRTTNQSSIAGLRPRGLAWGGKWGKSVKFDPKLTANSIVAGLLRVEAPELEAIASCGVKIRSGLMVQIQDQCHHVWWDYANPV